MKDSTILDFIFVFLYDSCLAICRLAVLALFLAFPQVAYSAAEDVWLFTDKGEQIENYQQKLANLNPGDRLHFSNGKQFKFVKKIGEGRTTRILEVKDSDDKTYALRLPLASGIFNPRTGFLYTRYIDFYIQNAEHLEAAGIIPKVQSSAPSQYVLVDKINFEFSLEDFIFLSSGMKESKRIRIEHDLYKLARKMAAFKTIGDIRFDQLVYDGNEWKILDFTSIETLKGEIFPVSFNEKHPVREMMENSNYQVIPRQKFEYLAGLSVAMKSIIYQERLKMGAAGRNFLTGESLFVVDDLMGKGKLILEEIQAIRDTNFRMCREFYLVNQ